MLARATNANASSSWQSPRSNESVGSSYQNQRDGSVKATLTGEANNWETPSTRLSGGKSQKAMAAGSGPELEIQADQWPTPKTNEATGAGQPGAGGLDLRTKVELWPTPVDISKGGSTSRGGTRKDESLLNGMVAKWTTPQAHDVTERDSGQQPTSKAGNACLARDARTWPSPRAEDSESCGNHPAATDSLTGASANWPTPKNRDGKGQSQRGEFGLMDALPNMAENFPNPQSAIRNLKSSSPPVQVTTPAGSALSPTAATTSLRRRLNPAFVCWLMGWPWWWTRPEPISFAAPAMASWHCRLRSRLWNFYAAPGN